MPTTLFQYTTSSFKPASVSKYCCLVSWCFVFFIHFGIVLTCPAQTKRVRAQGELNVDLSKGIDPGEYSKKIKKKAKALDDDYTKNEVIKAGEEVLDDDTKAKKDRWTNQYNDLKDQGWDSLSMAQVDTEALQEMLYPLGMQDLSQNLPALIRHKEEVADLMENDSIKQEFLNTLDVKKYQSKDSLVNMMNDKDHAKLIEDNAMPYFASERGVSDVINNQRLIEEQKAQFEQEQIASTYGVDPGMLQMNEQGQLSDSALMVSRSKYEDHFSEHKDKIEAAQSSMEVVREKPSFMDFVRELVNQDMERVEEMELKDRFSFGGYFQIQRKESTIMDLSPNVGYKLTGKLSAHVGGTYRVTIEKGDAPNSQTNDLIGYNVFLNYQFLYGVYFHTEFESLRENIPVPNTDQTTHRWTNGYLFGLGRDFMVRPGVNASILLLYDFNHSDERPFASPWHVRFGFNF